MSTLRILHTSDWHLGQTLHEVPRDFEHGRFLRWLLDQMEAEAVDALLITGDVFDSANPPPGAQRAYYDFLAQVQRRLPLCTVVVIGGNHDSPGRLDAPASLLSALGIHALGALPRRPASDGPSTPPPEGDLTPDVDADRVLVPLHDRHGAIAAWVVAVPFLRRGDLPGQGTDAPQGRLGPGYRALYRHLCELAQARKKPGQALLAMGHCFLDGGRTSNSSERPIQLGNQALPLDIFPSSLCYVALGHLHLGQQLLSAPHVRYAGSPIPLSLIERDYQHHVVLLELEGEVLAKVRELPVPRAVEILSVPDEPRPLAEVLPLLRLLPRSGPAGATEAERPLLEVRVQRDAAGPHLRQQIEEALEGAWPRLVRIQQQVPALDGVAALGDQVWQSSLKELDPEDVFQRCWVRERGGEVPGELLSLFRELRESLEHDGP